jgi:hypothetical protein
MIEQGASFLWQTYITIKFLAAWAAPNHVPSGKEATVLCTFLGARSPVNVSLHQHLALRIDSAIVFR